MAFDRSKVSKSNSDTRQGLFKTSGSCGSRTEVDHSSMRYGAAVVPRKLFAKSGGTSSGCVNVVHRRARQCTELMKTEQTSVFRSLRL